MEGNKTLKIELIALVIILMIGGGIFRESFEVSETEDKYYQFYETTYGSWQAQMYREEEIEAVLTAYTPRVEETDSTPNIMASGARVYEGAIACPVWMKFGDLVEYDGKVYTCEDRKNPRYQQLAHFDILMFNLKNAREFGKKVETIKLIRFNLE